MADHVIRETSISRGKVTIFCSCGRVFGKYRTVQDAQKAFWHHIGQLQGRVK